MLAAVVLVACRTAQPIEMPRAPAQAPVDPSAVPPGLVIDANYLRNIPVPDGPDDCFDGGYSDSLGPPPFPGSSIAGRYMVDGIYMESRGPRYPLGWLYE